MKPAYTYNVELVFGLAGLVLDDRTLRAFVLRYGLDGGGQRTLEEVSCAIGLKTRESARRVLCKGASHIRREIRRVEGENELGLI